MTLKRLILFVLFLLLVTSPVAAVDLSEGFSGIKWGSNLSEPLKLIKVGSNADVEYYINPHVVHTIDNVNISQVIYGFYNQRFFAGFAHIDDLEAFSRMKEQLQTRYGIPKMVYDDQGNPSIYRWKSGNIKIKLKSDASGRKMKAAFYYTPISKQINEDKEENFRENRIEFLPIERDKTPKMLPLFEF